jgi:hypothetical protein
MILNNKMQTRINPMLYLYTVFLPWFSTYWNHPKSFHIVKPNLLYSEFGVYMTRSYEVWLLWCIKHIYLLRIRIIIICITRPPSRLTHSALWNVSYVSWRLLCMGGRGGGVCVNICVPSLPLEKPNVVFNSKQWLAWIRKGQDMARTICWLCL